MAGYTRKNNLGKSKVPAIQPPSNVRKTITKPIFLFENIAIARAFAGLSQNKLAQLSGVAQGQISKLESGINTNPAGSVIVQIAHALNLPTDYFFKVK